MPRLPLSPKAFTNRNNRIIVPTGNTPLSKLWNLVEAKIFIKTVSIIAPVIAVFAFAFVAQFLLEHVKIKWLVSICLALIGIAGAFGIHALNNYMAGKAQVPYPVVGSLKGLGWGVLLGLAVSMVSGLCYYAVYKPEISLDLPIILKKNLPSAAASNIFSASIEETAFRGGVVHFVGVYWGKTAGLLCGSVPFGLAHLAGRIWGQPVGLLHVIGTAMAGLLLSLAYLRWGLLSAIGVHWIWNSLCVVWVKSFCLGAGGAIAFEGSATTIMVLLAACLALLCVLAAGRARQALLF